MCFLPSNAFLFRHYMLGAYNALPDARVEGITRETRERKEREGEEGNGREEEKRRGYGSLNPKGCVRIANHIIRPTLSISPNFTA